MKNISTNSTLSELDPLLLSLLSPIASSIHSFNLCLSLPLNIYIIILLIRSGVQDGSAFYRLNQAFTDIAFSLQTPLFILCFMNITNLCFPKLMTFFTSICLNSRFSFQCSVCFERYLAVVHPVIFLKYKTRKYHLVITSVMWVFSLACAIAMTINYLNFPYTVFVLLFTVVLKVYLFLVFSILRVLRRPGPGEKINKDGGVSVVKKKALKFVSLSLLAFLIQFTPLTSAFIIKSMVSPHVFNSAFIINMNFNTATGIVQPVLSLHQMGKVTFTVCKYRKSTPH